MNLGTILYLPPHGRLNSDAFADNLGRFKTRYPVMILTDDTTWHHSRAIDNPERIRGGRTPAWAINNYLFFKSLELARDAGLDYWFYVEVDSRVNGDYWDEVIWKEHFERYPNGITCAGSPVCWDVSCGGPDFAANVIKMAYEFQNLLGVPAAFYGSKSPHDCTGGYLYPNGSLATYCTRDLLQIFAGFDQDIIGNSRTLTAFDLELGRRLWHNHGPRATEHVGFLTKCYSGFGDCIVSCELRKQFLTSGKIAAVHQIKDQWVP